MKYCLETLNGAYGRRDVLLSLLLITSQFASGRVYAKITSRPGQSGRCDGILVREGQKGKEVEEKEAAAKQSDSVVRKIASRQKGRSLESSLDHQFASGRVYAKITSRPGQSGRCDGILVREGGPELVFYQKMMAKK